MEEGNTHFTIFCESFSPTQDNGYSCLSFWFNVNVYIILLKDTFSNYQDINRTKKKRKQYKNECEREGYCFCKGLLYI